MGQHQRFLPEQLRHIDEFLASQQQQLQAQQLAITHAGVATANTPQQQADANPAAAQQQQASPADTVARRQQAEY